MHTCKCKYRTGKGKVKGRTGGTTSWRTLYGVARRTYHVRVDPTAFRDARYDLSGYDVQLSGNLYRDVSDQVDEVV